MKINESGGIGKYYFWSFRDRDCGHRHHSFEAAEKCGRETISAAMRARAGKRPKFFESDEIAKTADAYPELATEGVDFRTY
jgi:hypothetical protein